MLRRIGNALLQVGERCAMINYDPDNPSLLKTVHQSFQIRF
ncbi:hypothetical protein [Paenibacillus herberti]|nr:hypothetical protein [Paenibacillus herberti]